MPDAFFLWILSEATATAKQILASFDLLPFAGLVIVYLYKELGKNSDGGNNLIMDEIHQPGAGIPYRDGATGFNYDSDHPFIWGFCRP